MVRTLAALCTVLTTVGSAQAGEHPTLLGAGYWAGFVDFWTGQFKKQDSIILFTLGIGALAIFIITRGKWRK